MGAGFGAADRMRRPQGGLDTTAASGTLRARGRRLPAAPVHAANEQAWSAMLASAARRVMGGLPGLSPALTPGQRRRRRRAW